MSTLSPSSSNKLFIWLVCLFCFVFGSRKPLLCCMFISLGALLIFEFRISFFSIQKLYFTEYSAWFSLWLLSPNSFLTLETKETGFTHAKPGLTLSPRVRSLPWNHCFLALLCPLSHWPHTLPALSFLSYIQEKHIEWNWEWNWSKNFSIYYLPSNFLCNL